MTETRRNEILSASETGRQILADKYGHATFADTEEEDPIFDAIDRINAKCREAGRGIVTFAAEPRMTREREDELLALYPTWNGTASPKPSRDVEGPRAAFSDDKLDGKSRELLALDQSWNAKPGRNSDRPGA